MKFFELARQEVARIHSELAAKTERFYLAGNSLGAFVAWFYATKYPERVEKLILVAR